MLNRFAQLLGDDAPAFKRYLWMAAAYGLLSGLTLTGLVPVLSHVLRGDVRGAVFWLALLVLGGVLCWAWRLRLEKAGIAVGVAVLRGGRQRLGEHVAGLPVGWFTPDNTARLGHLISHGMMAVAQLPAHVFTPLISAVLTPLVMVVALFSLHWQMGLVALLALPLIVAALRLTAHLGQGADHAFHQHFAASSQRMVEFAQAQPVLRAFNAEGGGTRLLEQAIEQQRQAGKRLVLRSSLSAVLNAWTVHGAFAALLVTASLWINAQLADGLEKGAVTGVIAALLLSTRYLEALLEVASYAEILRSAHAQLDTAYHLLAVEALPEPGHPQQPADASIDLRQVSFRYAPDQPEVLRDIDLQIAPGSMTALIGASGSGKTTLVRLIARFFDATHGSVRIGGAEVRQIPAAQLAGQISQIFQDTYLFQGSIADNIRLGKADASMLEILEAARQAGVSDILERLPEGLDTQVGEGGARLSGGERQRITIARALIKDAPILLVDEATAALDSENQAIISETLARLHGQRTLVVIAHQLSTVAMADRIVVLDEGRVVEQGTPQQLQALDGYYAGFIAQRHAAAGWRIADSRHGEHA